jgi:hypothetical protein
VLGNVRRRGGGDGGWSLIRRWGNEPGFRSSNLLHVIVKTTKGEKREIFLENVNRVLCKKPFIHILLGTPVFQEFPNLNRCPRARMYQSEE